MDLITRYERFSIGRSDFIRKEILHTDIVSAIRKLIRNSKFFIVSIIEYESNMRDKIISFFSEFNYKTVIAVPILGYDVNLNGEYVDVELELFGGFKVKKRFTYYISGTELFWFNRFITDNEVELLTSNVPGDQIRDFNFAKFSISDGVYTIEYNNKRMAFVLR